MGNTLFSGLIHVTGDPDSGKSTFALECGPAPDEIAFIDDDVKGKSVVRQLIEGGTNFAIYHDLVAETRDMKELKFHQHCMGIVDEIMKSPKPIKAVVWDTWTRFEQSFKPVVTQDPKRFKDYWSTMGAIKGPEEWSEAQRFEVEVINRLLTKTELLILTTHLKAFRIGGREIPGKQVPRCQAPLIEKSLFRLWLRRNPNGRPVPIGLVLKRLGVKRSTDIGIRTMNVLPQRIVPRLEDESLWDTIRWYWKEPIGGRIPTLDEMPNEYELSIIDGTLTSDQRMAFQLVLADSQNELASQKEAELPDPDQTIIDNIKNYLVEHADASNADILKGVEGAKLGHIIKAKK